jgi:hypothetical protein
VRRPTTMPKAARPPRATFAIELAARNGFSGRAVTCEEQKALR